VESSVDQAVREALKSCQAKYDPVLARFAMLDGTEDITCIALLSELASGADGVLNLAEVRARRPDLRDGIDALLGIYREAQADLDNIDDHILYDPSAGKLLIEDPQLVFYLSNKPIEQLAAMVGKQIPVAKDQVFVSYSHQDKEWLKRLETHLRPLVRDGRVDLWADTRISAGDRWHDEIAAAISRAKAAVLLVSADFLASDFIDTDELPPLLHAAERQGCVILPVIVGPSLFRQTPSLSVFQAVNDPSRRLSAMNKHEQEETLQNVATTLLTLAKLTR
jgi:TIR domain